MVAHPDPMADERSRIPEQVRAFFCSDGVLARSGAAETDGFAFEARPQQMAMAETIAAAIRSRSTPCRRRSLNSGRAWGG